MNIGIFGSAARSVMTEQSDIDIVVKLEDPGQYRWSSYRATAGLSRRPVLLTVDWILGQFEEK